MQVVCGECGEPFAAKSPKAKWCSDRCRKRNERRPSPAPVKKSAKPAPQLDGVQAALLEQLTDGPSADHQAPKTPVAPVADEEESPPSEPAPPPEPPEPSAFEKATLIELEALKATDTMLGQQALAVARRVAGDSESGAAVASLSREHSRLMEQIAVRAKEQRDPVERARSTAAYVYSGTAVPAPTAAAS